MGREMGGMILLAVRSSIGAALKYCASPTMCGRCLVVFPFWSQGDGNELYG
ncbi:hypothetical protein APHNP_1633 [Anaplasma phagocytophilum str. ApNP]|uniref:Uncharacterized protein n=1 Tax=Anaplasma phagocytophilum str. ApNP TaxID=1359153 RepID=A0A0F3NGC8_ANAPH|nr:hypothetical protein APHNP_1633 [Anaplasma phagocytophilum str. ApNP]